MKIGELAKKANCKVVTIRFYEKKGLLPKTDRTESNYRIYSQKDLDRLRFIRHCRRHGMSLDEISELMDIEKDYSQGCGRVHEILNAHLENINRQINELENLKLSLQHMLAKRCEAGKRQCSILDDLKNSSHCQYCKNCMGFHLLQNNE